MSILLKILLKLLQFQSSLNSTFYFATFIINIIDNSISIKYCHLFYREI